MRSNVWKGSLYHKVCDVLTWMRTSLCLWPTAKLPLILTGPRGLLLQLWLIILTSSAEAASAHSVQFIRIQFHNIGIVCTWKRCPQSAVWKGVTGIPPQDVLLSSQSLDEGRQGYWHTSLLLSINPRNISSNCKVGITFPSTWIFDKELQSHILYSNGLNLTLMVEAWNVRTLDL